jgi:hypothetical protein
MVSSQMLGRFALVARDFIECKGHLLARSNVLEQTFPRGVV